MKIFDSSPLIAIFNQFQCPEALDVVLQLGHELAIPHFVWKELKDNRTRSNIQRLLNEDKLVRLENNSFQEIDNFQQGYDIDAGEIYVILTYLKLARYKNNIYCILDDKDAQKVASGLEIRHTDLKGLLKILHSKGVECPKEIDEIIELLERSEFSTSKCLFK